MSDSEEDFMSDKFLLNLPPPSSSSSTSNTYTARREQAALKGNRSGLAKNQLKARDLEEVRRREGMGRSLFEREDEDEAEGGESESQGGKKGNKAMEMMMKMGWKVGEGLGKKRSPSPPPPSHASSARAGLGAKRFKPGDELEDTPPPKPQPITEPIRVSLWARRKGLSAREPSPPPLPLNPSGRNPDALGKEQMERLAKEADGFRARQGHEWGERDKERKGRKCRDLLVGYDKEKGVKFHALHVLPFDPLGTMPRPILKLIYPAALSPSPSPSASRSGSPLPNIVAHGKEENKSEAERLREQMRRDMLSDIDGAEVGGDEEKDVKFGVGPDTPPKREKVEDEEKKKEGEQVEEKEDYEGVDWEEHVAGTKRVLSMEPGEYLTFIVNQLRHEHLFCFWCAYKYSSWDELEGPGGCPGEEEDDH
ncbi:hypothetical protein B9479_000423 [Cryptococcus floricola]|uniref:G-patch domain-containing protein n=1 Tax=Cryptococcus floricola TaxID=2591691 RepID=A0A5D3B832_9TREE|nr:hypothetical protein B9479_000423 [Cryptococcus floricola]